MKIIDLSHTINSETPAFPGDPNANLKQTKYFDHDHYNNHLLTINMHTGTHIDGPMHLLSTSQYINTIPLENFIGNGCLIDAAGKNVISYIPEYEDLVNRNDIVLIYTGHYKKWKSESYFYDYPLVEDKLIDLFIKKEVKIVGTDTPSPDKYPFLLHKKLLSNGILILENLTNLSHLLNKRFEVIALPLKLDADSSMVRAVAKIY